MKKIIRLQDNNGAGIFNTKLFNYWNDDQPLYRAMVKRHSKFNTPQEDPGIEDLFESGLHKCAYKSVDQMNQWIMRDELKYLIQGGVSILCLTVSKCLEGDDQICYDPSDIINIEDLTQLFE